MLPTAIHAWITKYEIPASLVWEAIECSTNSGWELDEIKDEAGLMNVVLEYLHVFVHATIEEPTYANLKAYLLYCIPTLTILAPYLTAAQRESLLRLVRGSDTEMLEHTLDVALHVA